MRELSILQRLETLKGEYGGPAAREKLRLLEALDGARLRGAGQVERLHEVLCFLRAWPDDAVLLARVERMLAGFASRSDLRRHRRTLADTGIAGTEIRFAFFWFTALRLARRWGGRLTIDWPAFEKRGRLETRLHLLTLYCETPALDGLSMPVRDWLAHLKGSGETDAHFLIERFASLRLDSFARETLFEELDVPLRLAPGPGTPSRTHAIYRPAPGVGAPRREARVAGARRKRPGGAPPDTEPGARVFFQTAPLSRTRPSLAREARRRPVAIRDLPRPEAEALIELARDSMVTRSRDLDAFEHASADDVRLVECGGGLAFACIGVVPERRLLLEAVYGFLTLKNGVPIGYVLASALFGSSEIAYNVFETFRGGESALVYGRVIAMARALFGSDTFAIDPYQLGHHNDEAIDSGAWWFYRKMGFVPHDPEAIGLMRREERRLDENPRHRSSRETLVRLARSSVFLHLGRKREDVLGILEPSSVAWRLTEAVAARFGPDRERAARVLTREAMRTLGVRSLGSFTPSERLWWERWSPLVAALPGLAGWSRADRRALVGIIRAKGGRRESEFVRRFDRHARLRRAVVRIAAEI